MHINGLATSLVEVSQTSRKKTSFLAADQKGGLEMVFLFKGWISNGVLNLEDLVLKGVLSAEVATEVTVSMDLHRGQKQTH